MGRRAGSYRFDRRRKEDLRKAKQEAKRQRRTDRQETGQSGPEMGEPQVTAHGEGYTWFSPARNRVATTPTAEAPVADGVSDWVLIEQPGAGTE